MGVSGAPALGGPARISAKASEALQVEDTGEALSSHPPQIPPPTTSTHVSVCVVSGGWWGSGVARSPAGTGMFTFGAHANADIGGSSAAPAATAPDAGDFKGKEFLMITSVRLAVILCV